MKTVFNMVALLCLAVGFGGIVWCGEWRMLLVFPVAFGLGIVRNTQCRVLAGSPDSPFFASLPWTKIQTAFRIFASFTLCAATWWALDHFSGEAKEFGWIKACWITGLLLQPWHWTGETVRLRIEAYIAFVVNILCVGLILVVPESFVLNSVLNPYVLLLALIVANVIMNRKEVSA